MNPLYVVIAGFTIKIVFKDTEKYKSDLMIDKSFRELLTLLRDFIVLKQQKSIDFIIEFCHLSDLNRFATEGKDYYTPLFEWVNPKKVKVYYEISIFQVQFVLHQILESLLPKNAGFKIHSSSSKVEGEIYLFVGKSGAGKSTVSSSLNSKYSTASDDISVIRKNNRIFYFYQTPFVENTWIMKTTYPYRIGKILFLKKADYFRIERISDKDEVSDYFLQHLLVGQDKSGMSVKYALEFIDKFDEFYSLSFAKDQEALIKFIDKIKNE